MLIDTDFNCEDTKAEIMKVFEELSLEPKHHSFLTHLHSDHTGLLRIEGKMGLVIYASKI